MSLFAMSWLMVGVARIVSPAEPVTADRAMVFGLFLDNPPPAVVIDEAIEIADGLRRRFAIDSGDLIADREAAARRAAALLDDLVFTPGEIRAAAEAIGYSLDPASCRPACADIRALAETELRKRALRALAAGGGDPPEAGSCP